MPDVYLRSIEPLTVKALGACVGKEARRKGDSQCPTAPKVLDLAEPRDAQFVMASLVSSGTTRGELPSVPESVSITSGFAGQVIAIGWAGSE
jgi:hypothetical protein